jgi:hypothetical protein
MKKISIIFIVLAFALVLAGCVGPTQNATSAAQDCMKTPNKAWCDNEQKCITPAVETCQGLKAAQNGRVVFTITDKAPEVSLVSSVNITIDSILVQNTAQSWVTVSSAQQTFDLLQLKALDTQALLADINLSDGAYNQVKLHISKVVVTDETGNHDAKLPSGDLKIVGAFNVNGNSVSVVALDFIVEESIHMTGNGEYILAPVVHIQTKENAEVTVKGTTVEVKNGNVKTDKTIGMDENGTVGTDNRIAVDAIVSIDSNGKIHSGNAPNAIVGGDKDAHGCIGSAGYSWCATKQKCIRSWEENCTYEVPGNAAQDCMKIPGKSWCDKEERCINPANEICG